MVTRPAPAPARAVSREGPASGEVSAANDSPDDQDSPGPAAMAESPPPVRDPQLASDPQPANTRATPAEPLPLTDPERWLWPAEGRLLSRF
ncbi:MAG: hypothetical protein MUE63_10820, partial [Xanthomonadales bacterium]|nr:hypothetical protein [Xanthomonadales bacterium]